MTEHIIKSPAKIANYIEQVRRLADANRSSLGFLPASAYSEAATKGCLWIAVDHPTLNLMGYLFFGGTYPHLKVFQVYICPEYRSVGTARTLVNELVKHGENLSYLTITARVASELKANKFWQALGFRIVRQVSGGKSNRTINIYVLDLDVPSLFREEKLYISPSNKIPRKITYAFRPILHTHSYVLDLNVFFDVVQNRGIGESAHVLSLALNNEIKLSVTSEFTKELGRHSSRFEHDPVLELAKRLPTLPKLNREILRSLIDSIRNILSPNASKTGNQKANDASDLIHLASCVHHRAYGFITRDAAILKHATELYETYNLRIVSPTDLSDTYENGDLHPALLVVAVGHQKIKASELDEHERSDAEKFLRDLGVEANTIPVCLNPGTTHSPRMRLVVRTEDEIIGIGSWPVRRDAGQDKKMHLYVNEDHPASDNAIDHFLESSATRCGYGQLTHLYLQIQPRQIRTREVAISRGFHPLVLREGITTRELSKISWKGVITHGNWSEFGRVFSEAADLELPCNIPRYEELVNTGIFLNGKAIDRAFTISLFDFETLISPGALICPNRVAIMVPIREEYASDLIASTVRQTPLFPGKEAALRLERAYFMGAGRHGLLSRGRLVVFYISRRQKEAVAIARITFSDTVTKTQAVLNLGRQGVLTEQEIHQRANSRGEVTAFTFDNVIVFPHFIPFQELKRIGCVGGANLVTAQELSHESLLGIVDRAFGANLR